MRIIQYCIIIVCFFYSNSLCSQNNKIQSELNLNPRLTNFSGFDFKANEQFYSVVEDQEGILYFGNNDGVVIYDGERWDKIILPNNSAATSLVISKDNKIRLRI